HQTRQPPARNSAASQPRLTTHHSRLTPPLDHRLRPRPHRRCRQSHRDRRFFRHPPLHVPRASPRQCRRSPHRHLFPRCHSLRPPHRPPCHHCRKPRPNPAQIGPRTDSAATKTQFPNPHRPRNHRSQIPLQNPHRPLLQRRRFRRRHS